MSEMNLNHWLDRPSAPLLSDLRWTPAGERLLQQHEHLGAALVPMLHLGLETDAIGVLAATMPGRRSVWWLCQAIWYGEGRRTLANGQQPVQHEALCAGVEWTLEPTVANAQAALAVSQQCPRRSPQATLGKVIHAFTAEECIEKAPGLPAQLRIAQTLADGLVASVRGKESVSQRQVLTLGTEIASGQGLWNQSVYS